MEDTIIQGLREYFMECPLMADMKMNTDYLPEDIKKNGVEFSVDPAPADEVIQQYISGSADCQYVFVLRSVNAYSSTTLETLSNCGIYEALAKWIREQKQAANYPVMPDGMQPSGIEAIGPGYLYSAFADVAKYEIQCRLLYFRKGAR